MIDARCNAPKSSRQDTPEAALQALVSLMLQTRKPATFAELCDVVDRGPSRVREAITSLRASGCVLVKRQETLAKHIDVLFSDKTAKALGEWPRPADYYDPQPCKPRRKAA